MTELLRYKIDKCELRIVLNNTDIKLIAYNHKTGAISEAEAILTHTEQYGSHRYAYRFRLPKKAFFYTNTMIFIHNNKIISSMEWHGNYIHFYTPNNSNTQTTKKENKLLIVRYHHDLREIITNFCNFMKAQRY